MQDHSKNLHKLLKQNELFSSLTEADFSQLKNNFKEINLTAGEFLMRAGDPSAEFYIIVDGTLEILKNDESNLKHALAQLHAGDTVGEMTIFDHSPRSTSVRAITATSLIRIDFNTIHALSKKNPSFYSIFNAISKKISIRLRNTNEKTVKALRKQLTEYKKRVAMANFVIGTIIFLCFYILIEQKLTFSILHSPSTTVIGVAVMAYFGLFLIIIAKTTPTPIREYGINLNNWQKSIFEAILFSLPILAIVVIIKWIMLKFHFQHVGSALFDPYLGYRHYTTKNELFSTWLYSAVLYAFISAPMQELIARGGLQTALEYFLISKNKRWLAIIISNIIFSSLHGAASIYLAIIVFLPGLFWGWLYSRQRTLVGVWVSHALIGIWSLGIVGLWARTI